MLRDAEELLGPAVTETIEALDLKRQDAAAVKLAKSYAREIDEATIAKHEAAAMLAELDARADEQVEGFDLEARVAALRARMDAEEALRSLGPKLLQVLAELGATPAARSKIRDRSPTGKPNELAKFRQSHRRGA